MLLTTMMALTVCLASHFSPVVEPLRPIEEIWDIEDARTESAQPLVTKLESRGMPIGYDADSRTFYCPLPLDDTEWPDLALKAPEAEDLRMCFVDDYLFDSPIDAMAYGTPYQVICWTKTEFSYFSIVFTGIPQLCFYADSDIIAEDDTPIRASFCDGSQALVSYGRTHYRGGVTLHSPKHAYRIEFTKTSDGRKKIAQNVPGMGNLKNLILIPMIYDTTMMRDRISWDVYSAALHGDEPFGTRAMRHAEVFVNDSYEGVYLVLEPFDYRQEMEKAGPGHEENDYLYRVASNQHDRPWRSGAYLGGRGFELHYEPPGSQDHFAGLAEYLDIVREKDDDAFCRKALERIDLDSMLRHLLLVQGGGLTDNVLNNLYIWADRSTGRTIYRYFPWDMDATWGDRTNRIGENFDYWIYFPTCDRLISLDPEGRIRSRLAEIWAELRAGPLSEAFIEELVMRYAHELNDSGAAARNAERWGIERYSADGQEILTFANMRFLLIDDTVEYFLMHKGPIEFLQYLDYENKSKQIYFPDM